MIILDIEASGLSPASYPIEIGFFDTQTKESHSFLINPETAENWFFWDPVSEENVHHISYSDLVENGIDVFDAVLRLNRLLKGQKVYTDAVSWDQFWIDRLFQETLKEQDFQMESLYSLFRHDVKEEVRSIIKEQSGITFTHRVDDDCLGIYLGLQNVPDHYWL